MQIEQQPLSIEQSTIKQSDGYVSLKSQVDNFFCRRSAIESKAICKKVTQPEPFKFHTSSRQNDQSMQIIEKEPQFKAKQMPRYKFFLVKKSASQLTVPKTFNLATVKRGELKLNQSMQIQSVDNNEDMLNQSFKAQPIPNYNELASKFVNRNIEIKKPTIPKEMQFRTDSRIKMKKQAYQSNSEEKNYKFKARLVPKSKVFQVKKKICKPMECKVKIPMNSEQRSAQRKAFEDHVNQSKMKEQETKEILEKDKLNSFRKTLEFKAAPITKYKQIEIQKSESKTTVPLDVKFQTDERACKMLNFFNQSKENQDPMMMA